MQERERRENERAAEYFGLPPSQRTAFPRPTNPGRRAAEKRTGCWPPSIPRPEPGSTRSRPHPRTRARFRASGPAIRPSGPRAERRRRSPWTPKQNARRENAEAQPDARPLDARTTGAANRLPRRHATAPQTTRPANDARPRRLALTRAIAIQSFLSASAGVSR